MQRRGDGARDAESRNFLGWRGWDLLRAVYDLLREHPFVLWLRSTLVSSEEEDDSALLF